MSIGFLTAAELTAAYRRRSLSPVEVAKALLERIGRFQPALNFMCVIDPETTLAMARDSERRWRDGRPRGLVEGVPVTIKDLVVSRGWPTLRGSHTIDPAGPWDDDAPSVARLREAGAVFLGKTTVSELGWKGTGDNPLTGITRNPWNRGHTPGGSSAGAAVAAAIGIGPLHIGSDGAGSIRIPAAFTGVFGIKPTYGRVPTWPPSVIGSLAHVGPMSRTVADSALMLTVIGRPDPRFWLGVSDHGRDFCHGLEDGLRGLRIGYWPSIGRVPVDPEIAAGVRAAASRIEELGARVEEIDPDIALPLDTFRILFLGRIAIAQGANLQGAWAERIDPGYRRALLANAHHDARALVDADIARDALGRQVTALFEDFDLLLTPQMPLTALPCGHDVPPGSDMADWLEWSPFTWPFNMTTHPAASVPTGLSSAGLPMAMQVVGRRFQDDLVLRACHAFEAAAPFPIPPGYD
jgi:aspartyl-tRNA(Asn)/glutamyl-tRNA(Gln) amidotransferase subunit A